MNIPQEPLQGRIYSAHLPFFFGKPLCELLAATTISRTKVCLSDHETKDSIIRSSPLRYEKKIGHGKAGKLTLTLVTLKRELDWFGFTIAISIPLTSFTPGIYGGVRKIQGWQWWRRWWQWWRQWWQ